MGAYFERWHWPKGLKNIKPTEAFQGRRAHSSWEDNSLKATASEGRSILPVFAHFLRQVAATSPDEALRQHVACISRLAETVEMLQATARRNVDPERLRRNVEHYLSDFKRLFGPEVMTIKFHLVLHLAASLRRLGFLPNCFALERKHKVPKRFGNELFNTSQKWEASVLREVTCHHMAKLKHEHHFVADVGLLNPRVPSKVVLAKLRAELGDHAFETAAVARINQWETVAKEDVVRFVEDGVGGVGQVSFHIWVGKRVCRTVLSQWTLLEEAVGYSKWRRSSTPRLVFTEDILEALVWGDGGQDLATVLRKQR